MAEKQEEMSRARARAARSSSAVAVVKSAHTPENLENAGQTGRSLTSHALGNFWPSDPPAPPRQPWSGGLPAPKNSLCRRFSPSRLAERFHSNTLVIHFQHGNWPTQRGFHCVGNLKASSTRFILLHSNQNPGLNGRPTSIPANSESWLRLGHIC